MMQVTRAKKIMERIKVLRPLAEKSDVQLERAQKALQESLGFPTGSNHAIEYRQIGEQNLRQYLERKGIEHHHAKMVAMQTGSLFVLGTKFEKALKDSLKNRGLK